MRDVHVLTKQTGNLLNYTFNTKNPFIVICIFFSVNHFLSTSVNFSLVRKNMHIVVFSTYRRLRLESARATRNGIFPTYLTRYERVGGIHTRQLLAKLSSFYVHMVQVKADTTEYVEKESHAAVTVFIDFYSPFD